MENMTKPLTHAEISRKGGINSMKKLTKKQRKEKATKAINARWKKYREQKRTNLHLSKV